MTSALLLLMMMMMNWLQSLLHPTVLCDSAHQLHSSTATVSSMFRSGAS